MSDLTITVFEIGAVRFNLAPIYGLSDDDPYAGQVIDIPMLCYHIALPGRTVLVDAMAYDAAQFPESFLVRGHVPPPALLEQMVQHGLDASEISDVVITHAHFDHFGGLTVEVNGGYVPAFPNARHYLGAADWQPQEFDGYEKRTLGLVQEHGLLTLVEGELDLGDGLVILPAPGESDGHQILCLRHGERAYYFAGDLYHHVLEFEKAEANVNWADVEKMSKSKEMLMMMAETNGAAIYFSHIGGSYCVVEDADGRRGWQQF